MTTKSLQPRHKNGVVVESTLHNCSKVSSQLKHQSKRYSGLIINHHVVQHTPTLAVQSANWSANTDRQTSKQCYTIRTAGKGRASKSHHLLRCQMLRCQDQCPRCPMFQADGQNGFETSLTQLVSATPCQQTELYVHLWKQDNGRGEEEHVNTCWTHHTQFCVIWLRLSANLPAGLDSIYLCEVVIPYKTMSPDWNEGQTDIIT